MTNEQKLIIAQKEYIKLLGEEIDSISSLAYIHGWRSIRVKQGERARKTIAALEKKIIKEEKP